MRTRAGKDWNISLSVLLLAVAGARGVTARTLPGNPSAVAPSDERSAANAALTQAEIALAGNRLDEALARCQEALQGDPKSARAYYILGVIRMRLGKPEEAREAWLKAAQISPASVDTHLALGKLYLDTNHLTDATREFQTALKLGDSHGNARYGLGLAL